jgi:hypothetical protein
MPNAAATAYVTGAVLDLRTALFPERRLRRADRVMQGGRKSNILGEESLDLLPTIAVDYR